MKKHELLEKAMRDYPKETKFVYGGYTYISNGIFTINLHGDVIAEIKERAILFDYEKNKWAEIITDKPKSILDGKCAIRVSNEREFKLLMEHYESKGFKSFSGVGISRFFEAYNITSNHGSISTHVRYGDKFSHSKQGYFENEGYTIIPFADFAKEAGITSPKFILRSQDGVDLYEGDIVHHVFEGHGNIWLHTGSFAISVPSISGKTFSTKEAAEAWCKEQNKPKEVVIKHNDNETSLVSLEKVVISVFDKGYLTRKTYLSIDAIKSIWSAYQSLQEDKC